MRTRSVSRRSQCLRGVGVLLLVAALMAGVVGCPADPEPAEFADPDLEAAVREAIDIPARPIYPEDLAGLTSLTANERDISDLTGLEYATSLTELRLRHNQISDVKPLVDKLGLGAGDVFWLRDNPPSEQSINEYIPAFEARGVGVHY